MNELKDIRDKWFLPKYSYRLDGNGTPDCHPKELVFNDTEFRKAVQFIQSESYQLGRSEVIEEIEKWFKKEVFTKMRNSIPTAEIFTKLNQLKEVK